jgi:hypothetical protein
LFVKGLREAELGGKLQREQGQVVAANSTERQVREVAMRSRVVSKAARLLLASVFLSIVVRVAAGQEKHVAGEYVCTEARVAGKTVPCKAAPLSLKTDGRFELEGREGEYLVSGSWVELNGKVLKSRAKIEEGHKIVFRFHNKKGLCEMIYERRVVELGKTQLS